MPKLRSIASFFAVIAGPLFSVAPLQASLFISGQIQTTSGNISFAPNGASSPFSISGSGSVGSVSGSNYAYAQYSALAGYGQAGVTFSAQAACGAAGCAEQSVTGFLQIGSNDVLHVVNAPANERIQFSYALSGSGSLQSPANASHVSTFTLDDELYTGLVLRESCTGSTCQTSSYVPFVSGQTPAGLPAAGTISLPYTNGQLSFYFAFEAAFSCYGTSAGPCQLNFSFDPAIFSNAVVLDSSGIRVAGASLVADSGFNYASVPEPSSIGLLTMGCALLILVTFRKRFFLPSR